MTNASHTLVREIERHALTGQPVSKSESHDLVSLSRRILAPVDATKRLLAKGVVRSLGSVHSNDDTGRHSFNSDDLNAVRLACVQAVAERTIEQSDGTPEQIMMAARHAVREHVVSFDRKTGATKTELSRFPVGLVQFAQYGQEEEPGPLQRTATTAAKVAGAAGLGYAGAALLRGRYAKPGASILDQVKTGVVANNASVARVAGRIGAGTAKAADSLSAGAARVAAVLGKKFPTR